jgi:tetratricopeptide (TPR) repeat protein
MNRLATKVLTGAIILLCSCGSGDKEKKGVDRDKVLHTAPFKDVTDSLEDSPDNIELLLRRATLLSQNNLHAIATEDYQRCWKLTENADIALMYISNLLLSDNIREAVDMLKTGAEKFPDNTEFSRRLGEVYMQRGELNKALKEYDYILSKDSSNFEAWFDKGSVLSKMKDTSGAIASLETSFSLLPINYSGLALANLYIARKDPRALEVCNILLSRDSSGTQTEPIYMKGVYFTEVKEYDNALKQFDECIRRDWKMTDAYIEKGIILFERKNFSGALKVFDMAATVSNTDADAYYWMGRCFESTGDKDKAILNYQRAYSLDNSFIEAQAGVQRIRS